MVAVFSLALLSWQVLPFKPLQSFGFAGLLKQQQPGLGIGGQEDDARWAWHTMLSRYGLYILVSLFLLLFPLMMIFLKNRA